MNGVGRFNQPEPFQRDYDGDLDEGEQEDFVPPQRSFSERTAYNQHQQPQPYIPQNAFPQIQPQPVAAPVPNGAPQPVGSEQPYPASQAEGERMPPRRRRRRPIGEHQPKTFAGRPENGGLAQGARENGGSAEESESKPDEASS